MKKKQANIPKSLGGRVGGQSTSRAKVSASRRNGRLGGRPRSMNPSREGLRQRKWKARLALSVARKKKKARNPSLR